MGKYRLVQKGSVWRGLGRGIMGAAVGALIGVFIAPTLSAAFAVIGFICGYESGSNDVLERQGYDYGDKPYEYYKRPKN